MRSNNYLSFGRGGSGLVKGGVALYEYERLLVIIFYEKQGTFSQKFFSNGLIYDLFSNKLLRPNHSQVHLSPHDIHYSCAE